MRTSISAATAAASASAEPQREFEFSDTDFRTLAALAYEHAGIALTENKHNLVYSRISRRLRALGLSSFRQYREYLGGPDGVAETERFINSISTNHTRFFREPHHFQHFAQHVACAFAKRAREPAAGPLRIWSAGCSSGEEPYSIAAVLRKEIADFSRCDVRILATDIDTEIVAKAARGQYPATILDDVADRYRSQFQGEERPDDSTILVPDPLRALVTFRALNLTKPWPFGGPFDAIFCRNVMIYFDAATKATLVERFTKMLRTGGWLYIWHSESLLGGHPGLSLVGRTIYRRQA